MGVPLSQSPHVDVTFLTPPLQVMDHYPHAELEPAGSTFLSIQL